LDYPRSGNMTNDRKDGGIETDIQNPDVMIESGSS